MSSSPPTSPSIARGRSSTSPTVARPNGALQAGSADKPLELPDVVGPRLSLIGGGVTPERSRGRRLWWLWTSIGAVGAAGLGVGLYFALRPQTQATADAVFDFQAH